MSTTASTETSRRVVQSLYAAVNAGDLAAAFACIDENVVVIEPSFLPYGGKHVGISGFQALLGLISKYLDITHCTVDAIIADGEDAMVLLRIKAIQDGRELRLAERSIVRNGKVVQMEIYFHDLGALAAIIKR